MNRQILIVDDDRAMVRTLRDILTLRGWETTGAHSGSEAVALACTHRYSVVLMDIRMPGMDGIAACKAMKECAPTTRVVLMTAHATPEALDEAAREDSVTVLTKPIDMPGLMQLLVAA
jgi:CheY-like chemotaxis protein